MERCEIVIDGVNIDALNASSRWTFRRKSAVVVALREGRMTREQAQAAFGLTDDELTSWIDAFTTAPRSDGKYCRRSLSQKAMIARRKMPAGALA